MQRVRMSLPYFKTYGWEAEVVTVQPQHSDMVKDDLLMESLPSDIIIHYVQAFDKRWTSKLGLGSIALRSLWFYKQKVDRLLKQKKYDLIYFSTTQFPVCILAAWWKKRFGTPSVIDLQDPWHSDYYRDKSKANRPPKYWFSYRLNKYLEPIAIKSVAGLISVSDQYITGLKQRYPNIKNIPATTITFGGFEQDLHIANIHKQRFSTLLDAKFTNIVYVGRGGADMKQALVPLFTALQAGLKTNPTQFSQIRLYFIGTSYAPNGQGKPSIFPLAEQFHIEKQVIEMTDRISYYHALTIMQQASALFIPGSDDPRYTASKIFPYLLMQKPLLAIFHDSSSAINILQQYGVKHVYNYGDVTQNHVQTFLEETITEKNKPVEYHHHAINAYSADEMTKQQCLLFNQVIQCG